MKQRNPLFLATSPLALVATTLVASCLLLSSNPAQAQVTISSVYPNGAIQFQSTNALTFNASSPAGIPTANVSVVLTTTYIQNGTTFFRTLTTGNGGLTISGPATNLSVSAVLNSNTLYQAVISATDAASSTASTTVNFDTINGYTFEAEDYDYTSNGVTSLFIDNPQTNLYFHLGSTLGVDFNHSQSAGNAGTLYRPFNGGPAIVNTPAAGCWTENTGDKPRAQYNGTGQSDLDVGFTGGGDWMNYTRHYPPGTYNIFVRGASGNSTHVTDAGNFTVTGGTATLTPGPGSGTAPFLYNVYGSSGWQAYTWNPVQDSAGNLAQLTISDTNASQLRMTFDNANCNVGFYLLLPVTTIPVSTASVSNFIPDGSALFQSSSTLTFNVGAPDGVSPSDISVIFGGTNLYGHGFSSNLTAANGLSITGPSTNLLVSIPLTTNTVYSVFVQAFDAHGIPTSASLSFDTVVPFYTWEAEDFDFGGGGFIDNPQTNAYANLGGVTNVDFHGGGGGVYRSPGLVIESCTDKARTNSFDYINTFDYDVGNNNGGNWANYTRTYSNGTFNIYVRASDGGGGGSSDSGSMSLVTGGVGTTSQTVVKLGNWGVFPTGGWQTYQYVPVKDTAGNLVQFHGNGTVQTLRMTIDNGNCNENFFMLSPVDPTVVLQPFVDNFTPDGTAMFQPSNTMTFIAHSQPGTATSNIVVTLNGAVVPAASLTFSGTPSFRTVSTPVPVNAYYTAVVTITDANGSATVTNKFGTFLSTDYQLETEDYDYTSNGVSGLFFDNTVGAYLGLSPASGIDCFESDPNGANGSFAYRPSPTNGLALPCEAGDAAGDLPRAQFTSGGGSVVDYNIQYFGPNSWANYTRHYPSGTYGVVARTAEGNNPTHQTLWVVTGGLGTTNQTLSARKGTFNIPLTGWASWTWTTMVDGNGNPARVVFPPTGTTTLRLGGVPNASEDEANVNFLLLVKMTPSPQLAATVATGHNVISFPTETGYSYQVEYKNHLSDATWTNLGSSVTGDNTTHSVTDPALTSANSTRFYRVQVQ